MRFGSLFSGIDGFGFAAEALGWEVIFQVEIDEFAQSILRARFKNSDKHFNIEDFNGQKYRSAIDVLAGGFPCQPFSLSGNRKGREDDRFLWSHFIRVVREIRPPFVVAENVSGLISIEHGVLFNEILISLENEGYETFPIIIPSSAVNALHDRTRLFIVAHATGQRLQKNPVQNGTPFKIELQSKQELITRMALSPYNRRAEPGTHGNADALPITLDESRLHALGNSVDPYLVYQLFKALQQSFNY